MDEEILKDIFKDIGFRHEILSFKKEFTSCAVDINCNITSYDEIKQFVDSYQKYTNETLKVKHRKKFTEKSSFLERIVYRCHHDTRYENTRNAKSILEEKPTKRFRNTYCMFQLTVKLYKLLENEKKFLCNVNIEHNHNHPTQSLHAFSFKCISMETTQYINSLFDKGLTPSQAYTTFIQELKSSCGSDLEFHLKKADRSKCPRRIDFNALYIKFCVSSFGGRNGPDMFLKLEETIKELKEKDKEMKIDYQMYDKDEGCALIVAIVTPLMCRVHRMVRQSSEIMFVDSTSNLDEHNLRFFLLCTHSVAGALPLGIVITSDERETTLEEGFTMLRNLLPPDSFYNVQSPSIIMTDNCDELRSSLKKVWPKSVLLLCVFHILQQVWRWLFEKDHAVGKGDRLEIMKSFKRLVYSDTVEEFDNNYEEFIDSDAIKKYKCCKKYFEDLSAVEKSWALCYRKSQLIRGSNTNNYVEAQFLVVKDGILRRQRQFNINMLLDKVIIDFDDHFKLKLLSVADGTFDGVYSSRFTGGKFKEYFVPDDYNVTENIIEIEQNLFLVRSRTDKAKSYVVDTTIGRCECPAGNNGSPCWHQFMLWSKVKKSCPNFLPVHDSAEKKRFSEIAIGSSLAPQFYESVHSYLIPNEETNDLDLSNNDTYSSESYKTCNHDFSDEEHRREQNSKNSVELEDALNAFDTFYQHVKVELKNDDNEFRKSIMKFVSRYEKFSPSQRKSALQSFGTIFVGKSRSRIKVQPTAVSRRVSKIGSRQKQSTVKTKSLPNRPIKVKRKHCISEVIRSNIPSAKKAGRTMISNTKYPKRKCK